MKMLLRLLLLLIATPAFAQVATDNFNRASLGSDWGQLNTFSGSIQITSSTVATASAGGTGNSPAARWIGAGTITDDQYSRAQVTGFAWISADYFAGVIVRASSDTDGSRDHYWARVSADSGGPYTTAFGKVVNGTVTTFHSTTVSWANNDWIGLEIEGTELRVTKNGTALGGSFTTTDSDLSTGLPGLYISNSIMQVDNWEAGNIGGGGGTAVPLFIQQMSLAPANDPHYELEDLVAGVNR